MLRQRHCVERTTKSCFIETGTYDELVCTAYRACLMSPLVLGAHWPMSYVWTACSDIIHHGLCERMCARVV